MDLTEENHTIRFVENCDTFRYVAFIMANLYMKSCNDKLLAARNKLEWISLEMSMLYNQMNALQRPGYFEVIKSTTQLYLLFKNKGYLLNDKELDKLQQAMILTEKLNRLEQVLKNGYPHNYTLPSSSLNLQGGISLWNVVGAETCGSDYHLSEQYLVAVIHYMNDNFHLLSPNTPDKCLIRKIRCSNWTTDPERVQFACKTNIVRCMVDGLKPYYKHFNFAHIGRSGLFYSKKNHVISESGLSSAVLKNEEKKQCIMAIFM
jgi:hypothetical protein